MKKMALIALFALPCHAQQPGLAKLQQAVTDLTAAVQRLTAAQPSPGAGLLPGQTGLFAAFPKGSSASPQRSQRALCRPGRRTDPINCPLTHPGADSNASQVAVTVPSEPDPGRRPSLHPDRDLAGRDRRKLIVIPFTVPGQGPFGTNILNCRCLRR